MDEPQNPNKPIDEVIKDLYGPSEDIPSNQPVTQTLDEPPVNLPTDSTLPVDSFPPSDSVDIPPPTDFWPPVPPIAGTENAPKPPIFQTSVVEESAQAEPLVGSTTETIAPPIFTSPLPARPEPEVIAPSTLVPPPIPPSTPTTSNKKSKLLLILPFIALISIGIAAFLFIKSKQTVVPSGPVTLTYWGLFEPDSVFQQVIADYETVNPKIKINYQQQSGLSEYRERLATVLPKGSGPDIFRIHLSWAPMFTDNLAAIPSSIYSNTDFSNDYYPSAVSGLTTKKGLVGLPVYFDALALFYNEDLFRAAGQTPPTTWEDLIKSACTLTVRDQTGRIKTGGVAIGTPANVDHWSDILGLMLLQNGADPAIPDACNDRGVCPGKDALTFFSSFVKNSACRDAQGAFLGSAWSDLLPSSTYAFATGQVAMYFAPSWRVFDIKNSNPNLNFKVVPVPQLSTDAKDKVAWATYWVESVAESSTNKNEAWKFLKYLSSKEVLEKLYLAQTNLGGPRLFGEPYPRVEMASMLISDPWVGPFISQAPFAKNWYLSSYTNDNGINDGIVKYYEDAVNKAISGQDSTDALKTVTQGVAQVLSRYGVQPNVK